MAAYGEDETEQDTLLYVVFAETSESIDGRQDHGNAEKCRDQTGGNEGEEGWWVVTSRTQSPKAKQGNMSHQGKIEPLSQMKLSTARETPTAKARQRLTNNSHQRVGVVSRNRGRAVIRNPVAKEA